MQHADNEGKALRTRSELRSLIRTALAGRAAEMVYYGEEGVSTGASGDLDSATRTAKHMICSYGMDEKLGLACINEPTGEYFLTIHNRVNEILAEELENAIDIIAKNKAAIDALVAALIEKNHLKEKEIDEIFKKTTKK